MAHTHPEIYDMRLFDAACATSAAPAYWQLKCTPTPCTQKAESTKTYVDLEDGLTKPEPTVCVSDDCEYLIDGGVVQNNPATYAMSTAMMIADARGDTS